MCVPWLLLQRNVPFFPLLRYFGKLFFVCRRRCFIILCVLLAYLPESFIFHHIHNPSAFAFFRTQSDAFSRFTFLCSACSRRTHTHLFFYRSQFCQLILFIVVKWYFSLCLSSPRALFLLFSSQTFYFSLFPSVRCSKCRRFSFSVSHSIFQCSRFVCFCVISFQFYLFM